MLKHLFKAKVKPNRRYSARRKTRNLVYLTLPAEETLMNLIDLSESGAQLISTKPLRKNKVVGLKINLAEQNRQILLKGKVVWSRISRTRSRFYRIGVCFVEISQEAWMKLHSYLSPAESSSYPPSAA